ncbi:hypothetical protein ACSHT0_15380 [Tepidicaulis sp. LMO-SS28]|uniref:hypothetical protein n=1 Tax=Tepidicaulis sp. LMO-SS28 TaxID=3447455 RepID=UPI003EE1D5F7
MATLKKCKDCGSTEIHCQMLAHWDAEEENWVMDTPVDPPYCGECDSFEIQDVETS